MQTTLDLPTGRLIAGDPGRLFGDAKPLDVALPAGRHPVSVGAGRVELRIGAGEPERWCAAPGFATPSGYGCLLDAAALGGFTDLGDEPTDEYELLTERLAESPGDPLEYRGLLVFPAAGPVLRILTGYDRSGAVCRIAAQMQAS